MSSSMRYNARRKQKKLSAARPAWRLVRVESERELPDALDALFRLHAKRWQSKGQTGNFVKPEVRAFHRRVAPRLLERGILRLYQLDLGSSAACATLYCLRSGGRELYLQAGLDPELEPLSAGFCLMHRVIEGAIVDGMTEFDFLRGTEGYKTHWATASRTTRRVIGARRTPAGLAWLASRRALEDAKGIVKRGLAAREELQRAAAETKAP